MSDEPITAVCYGDNRRIKIQIPPQYYKKQSCYIATINASSSQLKQEDDILLQVTEKNNFFVYTRSYDNTSGCITIEVGIYTINQLIEILNRIAPLSIVFKIVNNRLVMDISNTTVVNFTNMGTIATVIGFNNIVYREGRHYSSIIIPTSNRSRISVVFYSGTFESTTCSYYLTLRQDAMVPIPGDTSNAVVSVDSNDKNSIFNISILLNESKKAYTGMVYM
jgi:hypothetical protein